MNRTLTHLISFGKLFGINHVFQLSGQGNQFAHVIHQLQQKTSQFFASLLTRYLNVIDLESRIGLLEVLLDLVESANQWRDVLDGDSARDLQAGVPHLESD